MPIPLFITNNIRNRSPSSLLPYKDITRDDWIYFLWQSSKMPSINIVLKTSSEHGTPKLWLALFKIANISQRYFISAVNILTRTIQPYTTRSQFSIYFRYQKKTKNKLGPKLTRISVRTFATNSISNYSRAIKYEVIIQKNHYFPFKKNIRVDTFEMTRENYDILSQK